MPATAPRPRTPTARKRTLRTLEVLGTQVVEMTISTSRKVEEAAYTLEAMPTPEGALALVRLTKLTAPRAGESYAVLCASQSAADTCDCPAGTYGRVARCRHVDALRALVLADRLPS